MADDIRRLPDHARRLICSGQVVTDLSTAVKELVENSLDAGATSVELRLVDHGASLIECVDDGRGIAPRDFARVAMRHATSKLRDFSALRAVRTLGFRGEALASLSEVAGEVTLATRCGSERVGARLAFSRDGSTFSTKPIARAVGTTVAVKELFAALPVRRVDFERNAKRHYAKAMKTLHAYALSATCCRIRVTSQVAGKRTTALAVPTGRTTKDAASSLFGAAFAQGLVPFEVQVAGARVSGLVSRAGDSVGRCEGDRQFVFCNGRPIDAPKIVRAANDAWRACEMKHKPACIIYFGLPPEAVDVNLSPNKREVLMDDEASLICSLKATLTCLWADKPSQPRVRQALVRPLAPGPMSRA
eukprot:CAMPEP_0119265374 /NCGR_PEP_ID=MMETSP1329-20130426/4208_1 /TAXON_ID=114041 /ORGANISM="Genus nov. species nov., Strain RCC1024" /LENGTH=360 /DNA_ID=CAMNT_0007265195 /DNA_START=120 /DNA_END=1198 /DNA_ORIENTATION=-